MKYRIEEQYKILIDTTKTIAAKRATALKDMTDTEIAVWEEKQRAQRREYLAHLRSKGRV